MTSTGPSGATAGSTTTGARARPAVGPASKLVVPPKQVEPWCRNLLHTFEELLAHLETLSRSTATTTERSVVVDAAQTVCALSQILDDYLHRGFLGFRHKVEAALARPHKLDQYLSFLPRSMATFVRNLIARGSIRTAARLVDGIASLRVRSRSRLSERTLHRAAEDLYRIGGDLGERVAVERAAGEDSTSGDREDLAALLVGAVDMLRRYRYPAALRRRVLKIPSGWKDFDCHPDDLALLAERFVEHRRGRMPVTVIGIRTSGSYFAPYFAGELRRLGWDASVRSVRQKVPFLAREKRALAEAGRHGTLVLVDDPPVTGTAYARVVTALEELGVARDRIVATLFREPEAPMFRDCEPGQPPPKLDGIDCLILDKDDWRIRSVMGEAVLLPAREDSQSRSRPETDSQANAQSAGDGLRAQPLPRPGENLECRTSRCHEKMRLVDGEGRERFAVKGSGYGWFEQQVADTARALDGLVPALHVSVEGTLATAWIDGRRLSDGEVEIDAAVMRAVARYVAERARRLPVRSGLAGDLDDRETGWHVLAQAFARSYSFLAPFSYYALRERLSRNCQSLHRAVIDARMSPREWFMDDAGELIKIDFAEHAFDRMDRGILDPVLDLAEFLIETRPTVELEDSLLAEYVMRSADVGALRRLPTFILMAGVSRLAELQQLLSTGGSISLGFAGDVDVARIGAVESEVERYLTRTANRFLARALDADAPAGGTERIFAIDLDGVFEDATLGFNATTPSGAIAVRTLKKHDIHPVFVTGRSLPEVRDRCEAFGSIGGSAEYGSVVFIEGHGGGTWDLATSEERAQLEHLRGLLAELDGVAFDPSYRYSIRVFRYAGGSRRALEIERVDALIQEHGLDLVRVIEGDAQLDIVGESCNKGRGVRVLIDRLGARESFAIGDTIEDVAMFRVVDLAFAPSNVRSAARDAMQGDLFVAREKLQRGVLECVRGAIHGNNTECAQCEPARVRQADVDLVEAFGLRELPRLRKILELVRRDALRQFFVSQ